MHCYQRLISLATPLLLLMCLQVQAQECYDNLDTIFDELGSADTDLEAEKLFVLCPNTVFEVGALVAGETVGGQFPIVPRSNTIISCGEDGSSANNCILRGGDYGVFAFGSVFFGDEEATNVVIRGLTFEGQTQSMAAVQQAGDFTFDDCVFQNSDSYAPILVNYDSGEVGAPASSTLFRECTFRNNTQRAREIGVEFGVMTIIGAENMVEVDDCIFTANKYSDFTVAPVGYAISLGSGNAMVLKNTCIIDNAFLGGGPVLINPNTFFVLIGNHVSTTEVSLLLCEFAARYPDQEDVDNLNPQCIPKQKDECAAPIYEGGEA